MRRRAGLFKLLSSVILAVVGVGVCGANVGALSYKSNIGVGFTFEPTLNVTLSDNSLNIYNIMPGTNAQDSNVITVEVSTNVADGYNLSATVGSAANATTSLVNGNNNFTSLTTSTSSLSGFGDNTWGYSYSTDAGTNWVSGDAGSTTVGYAGLPLYTGTGVNLTGNNSGATSSVQFKIAAKAGNTQVSGTYNNVINFTAVSNVMPMTLLDAFVASNATQRNGYYTMQGMTPSICSEATVDSSIQLLDVRDDKIYWVTKLGDRNHGDCWMTQNLDLDLISDVTAQNYVALTSNNTDLSTDQSVYNAENTIYALKGSGDTYGYTYENGVATWIPERSTIAYDQLSTWQNSQTYPYSYDRLDTAIGADNGQPVKPDSNVTDNHGLSGNYYNWTASLASNDSSNADSTPDPDQINSICPKGWRLPSSANREFASLLFQYGIIDPITSTNYIENQSSVDSMGAAPLYFVRGGRIGSGKINNSGSSGYYWSSTFSSVSNAYYMGFNSNNVYPRLSIDTRSTGFSVRCVARSQ